MRNFERKFGKYAIKNLTMVMIICYAIGYCIELTGLPILGYLTLNPQDILHGQVWRLFTWLLIPPRTSNLFFALIMLYFYYSIGTSLENTWGTYRYNVYIFSGILFTILGSFLYLGCCHLFPAQFDLDEGVIWFSTYYICMSIFLAFAATYPDATVLLMFVIPVKIKVLGILEAVMLVFEVFMHPMAAKIAIIASMMNFLVFWFTSKNHMHRSPKQIKRRAEFKRNVARSTTVTRHKCAICGRTEVESPGMQFRFCSKCEGNYEYCEEHLYTHTHVKR